MTWRLTLLATAAFVLGGCGGNDQSTSSTTSTTAGTTVRTYFFRDAALVPVKADVPQTIAPARAALDQLLGFPPDDYTTALPDAASLDRVEIDNGLATANFSSGLGTPLRTAQAQIVATLMQFPSVQGVSILVDGAPVPLQDGSGKALTRPATNADYVDLTADALIFVRTPARDSTVSSPVHASGTANVFEATIHVQIWSGDKLVGTRLITATSGSGTRGTWQATLPLPSGDVRLLFYSPSAEDGSHQHETEVRLHVR